MLGQHAQACDHLLHLIAVGNEQLAGHVPLKEHRLQSEPLNQSLSHSKPFSYQLIHGIVALMLLPAVTAMQATQLQPGLHHPQRP